MSNDRHIKPCIRVQREEVHPVHHWTSRLTEGGVDLKLRCPGYPSDAVPEAEAPKQPGLGPVGQAILGGVLLALALPFVGIVWAWAIGVIQRLLGI